MDRHRAARSTALKSRLGHSLDAILGLIWPLRCPVCGAIAELRDYPWCAACTRSVHLWREPICPRCRRFLTGEEHCCSDGASPSSLRIVVALGAYDGALGAAVQALKYDQLRAVAAPLGRLLAARLQDFGSCHAVVAVPTTEHKRRERGFGHAEVIAERLAQELAIPFVDRAIRFTRRVADQTRLSPAERHQNVQGAFAVPDDSTVRGRDFVLVDDVMTTGATIGEASRVLMEAGAIRVTGAVVALNLGPAARNA
ncbi:MAG: ComF family protein [Candidatus Zixiibacteriota bacterium]